MKIMNIMKIVCFLLCFIANFSQAAQFAVSIEKDTVNVGERVEVDLISLANGSRENVPFPDEIICELSTGEEKFSVLAKKDFREDVPGETKISDVTRQLYVLRLPQTLQGQVVISFADVDAPRIVLDVVLPQPQKDDNLATTDMAYPTLDSLFALNQGYRKNASPYKPVYFLLGTDLADSKFQISFKYQFFDSDSSFAETHPWIQGVHFAYTQTSFWDLDSASAPFDDTSYKPELFWLSQNYLKSGHGLLQGVFFQSGFQHESNGKDGDSSRSTNYLYIKPVFVFYDNDSRIGLQMSPKIWVYVANDDTNGDLPDYRGYFELETKFGQVDSLVAMTNLRWADEGVSVQFDVSYPLHKIFGDSLDIYLYAQYSNMLAESLLDYQQRTESFRFGLAFMR